MATPTDDQAATSKATAREILNAPSILLFLSSKQRETIGSLLEEVRHPAASLIQSYVEEVISAHTGPLWYTQALETAISEGAHALACTPEMTTFIRGEKQRRIKDGFSILLHVVDAVRLF